MASIITKILTANFLLALGLLLVFLPKAEFVGPALGSFLLPYEAIGALLVVAAGLMSLYGILKK